MTDILPTHDAKVGTGVAEPIREIGEKENPKFDFGTVVSKSSMPPLAWLVINPDLSITKPEYSKTPDKIRTVPLTGCTDKDWKEKLSTAEMNLLGLSTDDEAHLKIIGNIRLDEAKQLLARYLGPHISEEIAKKYDNELLGQWEKAEKAKMDIKTAAQQTNTLEELANITPQSSH